MKPSNRSVITLAAAAVFAFAPMSANATLAAQSDRSPKPAASSQKADQALTDRIESHIKGDAALKKYDIDISVKDAVVTLTGKVRTQAEQARAGRLAHIAGVSRVDNKLTLDNDAGRSAADQLEGAAKTTGEKTKSAAESVGEKAKAGAAKTGEAITDAWITTKVHSRFTGENALKGSDIDVDTKDHVVTLKGTVASAAGRARAVDIARTTDGVTKVVDQLTVK
jgi:osmotically-inducible protein OsmY